MLPHDIQHLIDEFVRSKDKINLPRSFTRISSYRDCQYHLKTSNIDLSPEADFLQKVELVDLHRDVKAVSFIFYDHSQNVLVTEYIKGEILFNVLWNGSALWKLWQWARDDRCRILASVIEWLSCFHSCDMECGAYQDPENIGLSKRWLIDSIFKKINGIRKVARRLFTERDLDAINEFISVAEGNHVWQSLVTTRIHGDFSLSNILQGYNQKTYILDFADHRIGFALEDVVRFWTDIWAVSQCGLRRRSLFYPMLRTMLKTYGLEEDVLETHPFKLMRLWNAVTFLHSYLLMKRPIFSLDYSYSGRLAKRHLLWLKNL